MTAIILIDLLWMAIIKCNKPSISIVKSFYDILALMNCGVARDHPMMNGASEPPAKVQLWVRRSWWYDLAWQSHIAFEEFQTNCSLGDEWRVIARHRDDINLKHLTPCKDERCHLSWHPTWSQDRYQARKWLEATGKWLWLHSTGSQATLTFLLLCLPGLAHCAHWDPGQVGLFAHGAGKVQVWQQQRVRVGGAVTTHRVKTDLRLKISYLIFLGLGWQHLQCWTNGLNNNPNSGVTMVWRQSPSSYNMCWMHVSPIFIVLSKVSRFN